MKDKVLKARLDFIKKYGKDWWAIILEKVANDKPFYKESVVKSLTRISTYDKM